MLLNGFKYRHNLASIYFWAVNDCYRCIYVFTMISWHQNKLNGTQYIGFIEGFEHSEFWMNLLIRRITQQPSDCSKRTLYNIVLVKMWKADLKCFENVLLPYLMKSPISWNRRLVTSDALDNENYFQIIMITTD